jgi:hypothetical protein
MTNNETVWIMDSQVFGKIRVDDVICVEKERGDEISKLDDRFFVSFLFLFLFTFGYNRS